MCYIHLHRKLRTCIYVKPQNYSKDTNLKIAFKTTSTIDKLLNKKQETNSYGQSGIYKITCQSCQTGRHLTRYKEHIRKMKHNKDESAFAQHILNKRHQYGPITEIM
jgi:hypothetical protein